MPPPLFFHPPLLNSASPWATDAAQLRALLACPSTGAITTRTSLLGGFHHRPESHRFTFFDPAEGSQSPKPSPSAGVTYSYPDKGDVPLPAAAVSPDDNDRKDTGRVVHQASLNNLGFSPLTLDDYLAILETLSGEITTAATQDHDHVAKTVIVSVTGTPAEVAACYDKIASHAGRLPSLRLAVEVNLSCPNIPGHPPPAYDPAAGLRPYLDALPPDPSIPVGLKTPPYTHAGQFDALVSTLADAGASDRISFLTATNTLGTCLVLGPGQLSSLSSSDPVLPVLPETGIGGMAGPPLHPLALGNVATLRRLLDASETLRHIRIIGVGGVHDGHGYRRMRAVGASAVAMATSLGTMGVSVFTKIEADIASQW